MVRWLGLGGRERGAGEEKEEVVVKKEKRDRW